MSWLATVKCRCPPYIHSAPPDRERYQTVYSEIEGSAAAPTAGLHFTPDMLRKLERKGVKLATCTLHIGLDTFQPVVCRAGLRSQNPQRAGRRWTEPMLRSSMRQNAPAGGSSRLARHRRAPLRRPAILSAGGCLSKPISGLPTKGTASRLAQLSWTQVCFIYPGYLLGAPSTP